MTGISSLMLAELLHLAHVCCKAYARDRSCLDRGSGLAGCGTCSFSVGGLFSQLCFLHYIYMYIYPKKTSSSEGAHQCAHRMRGMEHDTSRHWRVAAFFGPERLAARCSLWGKALSEALGKASPDGCLLDPKSLRLCDMSFKMESIAAVALQPKIAATATVFALVFQ